jgi:CheY-like chemotaxis protein
MTERKRILLVEDDQHSRKGLQASLLADGHGVEAVSDGWQAFRCIKDGAFDIALVDLDLPPVMGVPVTGWDVARILRAYDPAIPIVVMTAQEDEGVQRLARRFKLSAFMVKPVDTAKIRAFIRTLGHEIPRGVAAECTV